MEEVVGNNGSHNTSCVNTTPQLPAQMATMVAIPNVVTDNTWCAEPGATNHCTSDPNNLIIQDTYVGNDQIHMGNGTGLEIQHIGHKNCHTAG
ncbi:hypothetical protein CK203_049024 [Vitis vinifera]|uniref:Uncharacterized protein n=1 Tax=Vitis vinifera TaxID=29760 RepID=A0A438HD70_VITVI|nr:hypothetical protein CK203_049024 [Vitis vinifera]